MLPQMSRMRPYSFNYLFQEDAFSITTSYLKGSCLGHITRQEADFMIIEIFCMCKASEGKENQTAYIKEHFIVRILSDT